MKIKADTNECTMEFEGTDVFVSGVRIAKRKDNKWVSLHPASPSAILKTGEGRVAPELKSSIAGETH
jgi:hypothetical protein